MGGDRGNERVPAREEKRSGAFSRRRLLIGGGVVAGAAAAGWYGPLVVGDGFERHVASVLGTSTDLARALTEQAREEFEGRFELEAAQFVAATRFPGTELPAGAREEAIRHMLEAMLDTVAGKAAYAGRIPAADLASPCPRLGPV